MPRRYRLRFVYEKKNCSVSIDTLQINNLFSQKACLFLQHCYESFSLSLVRLSDKIDLNISSKKREEIYHYQSIVLS